MYRISIICLHRRLICINWWIAPICSTVNILNNPYAETWIYPEAVTGVVWGGMYTTQTKIREVYIHLVIFIPTGGIHTTLRVVYIPPLNFYPSNFFHPPVLFKQKCSYSNQAFLKIKVKKYLSNPLKKNSGI